MATRQERQYQAYRRRRVARLKRTILCTVVFGLLFSVITCIVLAVRVSGLNRTLNDLERQLSELSASIASLQADATAIEEQEVAGTDRLAEPIPSAETETEEIEETEETSVSSDAYIRKVYLTFDDGPSIYTQTILDTLESYGVKATFFVVGKEGEEYDELLREIVADGHTLGMHSYSHRYNDLYSSVDAFAADLDQIWSHLYDVTGVESTVYRFPGGSGNTVSTLDMQEFIDELHAQGIEYYDWNVASGDGGSRLLSTQEILNNCLSNLGTKETVIILLHDSAEKSTTVEALPSLIESLLADPDTVLLPITEDTAAIHQKD